MSRAPGPWSPSQRPTLQQRLDAAGTVSTMIDPADARDITRAARKAQEWLERRDRLIVEALRSGAGVREVARLAGLTHPTVLNIQRRDT